MKGFARCDPSMEPSGVYGGLLSEARSSDSPRPSSASQNSVSVCFLPKGRSQGMTALKLGCCEGRSTIIKHRSVAPLMSFFACGEDISHESPDLPLADPPAKDAEPFFVMDAIAGGTRPFIVGALDPISRRGYERLSSPGLRGSVKQNLEPNPSLLSTRTCPPWASTNVFTIARPRPSPPSSGAPLTNSSNTFSS